MSCFIMPPVSIRTLGNTLDSVFNAAKYSNTHSITTAAVCNTSLCKAFADCLYCECYDGEMIAAELFRINAAAYAGRYKEPTDTALPPHIAGTARSLFDRPVFADHMERPQDWHYHLASLLDCWLYQTSEDATRTNEKRIALAEFARNLKCIIVQHSEQYNKTRWGE